MTKPTSGMSRRSALGLLGAVPVTAGGLLAGAGSANADRFEGGAIPGDLLPGGRYDRFIAEQAAKDQFSGAVLLAHRGRPVLTRTYGMADKNDSIPNRPDTIFNIASVSKYFAAVAVTQLAQRGKVAFHDTIGTYLDGFPAEIADKVTIHNLFTHTSGLDEFTSSPEWQEHHDEWDTPTEELDGTVAAIAAMPPRAVAGTGYKYINSDYVLLGAIVAKLSGLTFQDYVRQNVFTPARMDRTDYFTGDEVENGRDFAHAYGEPGPDGQRPDLTEQGKGVGGFGSGAVGVSSTLADLAAFVRAVHDGTLLEPTYADLITSGKYPMKPEERKPSQQAYDLVLAGYGVDHAIVNDQRVIVRTGGGPNHGVSAFLSVYPDLDWVGVLLANYYIDIVPYLKLQDQLVTQ